VASSETAYVVYKMPNSDIIFERSMDWGYSWYNTPVTLGSGDQPCIAAVGPFVFVCWRDGNRIYYSYSTQGGSPYSWSAAASIYGLSTATLTHPNVSAITCGSQPGVLFVCQWYLNGKWLEFSKFGHLVVEQSSSHIAWKSNVSLSPIYTQDPDELRPSVATMYSNRVGAPIGANVYNVPAADAHKRGFALRYGEWKRMVYNPKPDAVVATSPGRLIARGPDGSMQYAAAIRPHVVSGPADADLVPVLVGPGSQPALAVDGAGKRWASYINSDTVWTMTGDGSYKVAFAGSGSAVPGQPSIVCYPEQANGDYVSAVVFGCYDTIGGTSRIMFARVSTSEVVLDTIESVANLRDSLPCVSVYGDSLVCNFQHGDSVLSVLLPDYGPDAFGRPPAWSSPELVTADGYHPMNVLEGGSVLNCVWTGRDEDEYAIKRATWSLSGGMFSGWTAQSDPSAATATQKDGACYAGKGVSVWQAKDANGKWIIKGCVRGEETTLVANDTDAYHPHAVAESSAINPSTDQVRVHLLWTEGVTFEVDSGVYDTGEVRFKTCSLGVFSNAGSNATEFNAGVKLARKPAGDSLFCVYEDEAGAVWYARSAAGDSWKREGMNLEPPQAEWPAIAHDSSGRRWVVVHRTCTDKIEAYYRLNSSWVGPQTLFTADENKTIGPAALAGASSTSLPIAYAAFKVEGDDPAYTIKVAKFDGDNLDVCTIASGTSLGDPSITVEPVSQNSDRIHVTWEDDGEVKYRMDEDDRGGTIADNWTAVVNLSNTEDPSVHPFIAADREQVVVAWTEGSTADIYSRKRSTGSAYNNWESSVNLSNTAQDGSDYPTIAMGDTVVVAWEEVRQGGSDIDVLVCIDFGDTLNIADNGTESGYPHVLFQNKVSGDTAIPYLHTVWSECAEYYEVGYNKLNLKQATGGGQQSASSTPIPKKPALSACRPNPFRDRTQINYQLPTAGNVSLRVYDVTGRTVRTLASGFQKPGAYSVTWDSRDSRGRQVAHGVYFYRLDTPGFRDVKKAVVTR